MTGTPWMLIEVRVGDQAADAGLKHQAPTQKREPINLKNLSTQERVSALLQNFSK